MLATHSNMKTQTFLIRVESGQEAVMRLPVSTQYGNFTPKAFKMVAQRFYNGSTGQTSRMESALNLEAYSTSESLMSAIRRHQGA